MIKYLRQYLNREKNRRRIILTIVVSLCVFALITAAVALALGLVFLLVQLGFIDSVEGQASFSSVILLMAVISLILGFLITICTSRLFLRPFDNLGDQLNRLAKGDFKVRLVFGKPYSSISVMRDIEDSFNKAANELDQTQMLRSDFINNFSHEVKTPIVSIAGFAKLLRRGNLNEEQQNEYFAIIEEEALRLSTMASNMLSLTKIENQTILTDVSAFNLSEQLRSAVLLLADKWSQKALVLDIELSEHLVYANEEMLKQVWINIIDNAIKFSENEGTLTIRINTEKDMLAVSISNEGKAIPKENIDRIFSKFYQADESHSTAGNGIGLAIVKSVVELHSGKINVVCENGITTFTVWIPKEKFKPSR